MIRGRRPRRFLALLAVAAAAGIVALWLARETPAPIAGEGASAKRSSKGAPPPVPLAAGGAHGSRGATAEPPGDEVPPPQRRIRVRGRVVAPADVDVTTGEVHVTVASADAYARRVLARTRPDREGRFEIKDVALDADVETVRAVATVPGFVTVSAQATPPTDGDVVLEMSLVDAVARGRTTSGRVFEANGRAIVGLPVFVTATPFQGSFAFVDSLDPSVMVESTQGPAHGLRGTATTDGDGRFTIHGLTCGACARAASASRDWVILENAANARLGGERALTAWPAVELDLSVFDEGSGKPVPEFSIHAVGDRALPWALVGSQGRLRVLWARHPLAGSATLDLSVRAAGHAPRSLMLTPRAGEAQVTAVVALAPLTRESTGRISVRSPVDKPIMTSLRSPGHRSIAVEARIDDLPRDRAGEANFIPVGEWSYEIRPRNSSDSLLAQTGSVTVSSARPAVIDWDVPPHGQLRLAAEAIRDRDVNDVLVLRSRSDARTFRIPFDSSLSVPVGRWALTVEDEHGTLLATHDVEIRENETTTIER